MKKLKVLLWALFAAVIAASALTACGGTAEKKTPTPPPAAVKHTVTFVTGVDGLTVNSVEVEDGNLLYEPDEPDRAGYALKGWYTDEGRTAKYDFTKTVTADFTLYADWFEAYKVRFDTAPTSIKIPVQVVKAGDKATEPQDDLYTDGADFDCWLGEDDEPFDFDTEINADVTLSVKWKKYNYVYYRWADGHDTPVGTRKRYEGEKAVDWRATDQLTWATQGIYWYTSNVERPLYTTPGDLGGRFDFDTNISGDITLYTFIQERTSWVFPEEMNYDKTNPFKVETAGQAPDGVSLVYGEDYVRFKVEKNEDIAHVTQFEFNQMALPFNADSMKYLRLKYRNLGDDTTVRMLIYGNNTQGKFDGLLAFNYIDSITPDMKESDDWDTAYFDLSAIPAGSTVVFVRLEFISSATAPNDNNGTDIMLNSAAFVGEIPQVTVNFETNGADPVNAIKLDFGNKIPSAQLPRPSIDGKIFAGWYLDDKLSVPFDPNKPVKNNVTLYAKYDEGFVVSFDTGDEDVVVFDQAVKPGEKITKPQDPVRNGYDFLYWELSTGSGEFDFDNYTVSGAVTLTAKWQRYFMVYYRYADGAGTIIHQAKINEGQKAEDYIYTADLTHGSQAHYWFLSANDGHATTATLGAKYDFSVAPTSDLNLYTYVCQRIGWVFPRDGQFVSGDNSIIRPLGPAGAGTPTGTVTWEDDGLRYKGAPTGERLQIAPVAISEQNDIGAKAGDTIKVTVKYKNFAADTTLRLIMVRDSGAVMSSATDNISANMSESDDWATVVIEVASAGSVIRDIQFDLWNGTYDLLIHSIEFGV